MHTVAAHFSKKIPASAANVNARRLHATPVDTTRTGPQGRELWISGLPVTPGRSLDRTLDAAVTGDIDSAVRTLTSLEGAFAAFLWDAAASRLIVINDFAGLYPIYMRRSHGALSVAPTIAELSDGTPDPAGWGAFIGFGHFVGERTSAAGVTRLPPATVLDYDASTDRLTTRAYWRWPAASSKLTIDRVDTGAIVEAIAASVSAYDVYGTEPTLLLSGGFESRLLAALLTRAGRRPRALTLRNPYEHFEIDGRFAAWVARELGLEHDLRDPDPDFFSTEKFLEYVRLHEVASTSVNLFIAQVCSELRAAGVTASWDGFPFGSVIKEKSAATFDLFLKKTRRGPESPMWRAAKQVFQPEFVDEMTQALDEAIAREIEQCHEGRHGTQQFFQRNRIRHRIAPNTLKVYANFILPLLPGLTKDVYTQVVPIPPEVRAGEAVYFRIFERHFPPLARLPWCSGGHLMPGTRTGLGYRAIAARSALLEHRRLGHLLRKAGLAPSRPESAVVTRAVRDANLDDPFMRAEGVRALQRSLPSGIVEDTYARELVFYWSMWREVMSPSPGVAPRRDEQSVAWTSAGKAEDKGPPATRPVQSTM
jgi:hypothetical protein